MIRIDAIWLATEPMDMRAGTETALARVITAFGAAKPHCAYLFANRRANRIESAGSRRDWCLVGGTPVEPGQVSMARYSTR
ncbi:IS66 family insertion sequence element accessory protein TnpB [Pseudomonas sp. Z4-7]|uniref:IS66 family insertion sequence element accessory protein TnpB n=1 Tax=Pseudomonas sp. Z4-7 TaxID=2817413 RepID=UPI003DA8C557